MPNNGTCEVGVSPTTMGRLAVATCIPTAQSQKCCSTRRGRSLANYFRIKDSRRYSRMCRQLDLEEGDNQTALLAQGDGV